MNSLKNTYPSYREKSVKGRYVTPKQISSFLKRKKSRFKVHTEGMSVQNRPIQSIMLGSGNQKILMWSQMHGNESTTTKAVLDLINYLDAKPSILQSCRIAIIPMLNPDGAVSYTRVNANEIDLNRDASDRTQPESVALRKMFDQFQPDYCFNLHDQRTIFNVGNTPNPATVSFLAPAHDLDRTVSQSRLKSMQIIAAINHELQREIPDRVGRYDDTFNPNCVGDAFQMTGTPTILFEAGHYPGDYKREHTREYIFYALTTALKAISTNRLEGGTDENQEKVVSRFQESDYAKIPENQKWFLDVLIENAHVVKPLLDKGTVIGVQYVEKLDNGRILFKPKIEKTGNLEGYFGHQVYNCMQDSDLKALKGRPELFKLLLNS